MSRRGEFWPNAASFCLMWVIVSAVGMAFASLLLWGWGGGW